MMDMLGLVIGSMWAFSLNEYIEFLYLSEDSTMSLVGDTKSVVPVYADISVYSDSDLLKEMERRVDAIPKRKKKVNNAKVNNVIDFMAVLAKLHGETTTYNNEGETKHG